MTEYLYKDRMHLPVGAQIVGERLEVIRIDNEGKLTPDMVVKDAKPVRSPLHKCFEWDDEEAAKRYRVDQARYMIRSLVVEFEQPDKEEPLNVRAFVLKDKDVDDHHERATDGYTSIEVTMNDPEARQRLLDRAMSELKAWRRRYQVFSELAEIFEVIDKTKEVTAPKTPKARRSRKGKGKRGIGQPMV